MSLIPSAHIGDIWDAYADGADLDFHVVVPVNIGWKSNGENVMGRGVAQQAAKRYPKILKWWGQYCRSNKEHTTTQRYPGKEARLIMFPTKPLDKADPAMSWRQKSSLNIIRRSAHYLSELLALSGVNALLPLVGCGNGGLDPEVVVPLVKNEIHGLDGRVLWVIEGKRDS